MSGGRASYAILVGIAPELIATPPELQAEILLDSRDYLFRPFVRSCSRFRFCFVTPVVEGDAPLRSYSPNARGCPGSSRTRSGALFDFSTLRRELGLAPNPARQPEGSRRDARPSDD